MEFCVIYNDFNFYVVFIFKFDVVCCNFSYFVCDEMNIVFFEGVDLEIVVL